MGVAKMGRPHVPTLKTFLFILVLPTMPQSLYSQETTLTLYAQYPDALYEECWCYDTLLVVPAEGVRLKADVYKRAVAFWNELGLGVTLRSARVFKPEQRDYVVLVEKTEDDLRQADICSHGLCTLAQFRRGPDAFHDARYGGYCHPKSSMLIHDRLYEEKEERIIESFIHELGHALGLDHVDGTLMQGVGSGGLILNDRQLKALRAVYPKR